MLRSRKSAIRLTGMYFHSLAMLSAPAEFKKGRIIAVGLGACSWSGSIVANGVTLVERDFGEVQLPGVVTLKHPILLAGRA
jgi:hypothetical protein